MASIAVVGQGLAGTLLAWQLERSGADFRVFDSGHGAAASRVAAGIVNPVTGQRLARTWRFEELAPPAREIYREIGRALGIPLWHDRRVRRRFRNGAERALWATRQARGELVPFAGAADGDGFWIEGAAHVDVAALLTATRDRWRRAGRLVEGPADIARLQERHELVILCTGAALRAEPWFVRLPWAVAKGEMLVLDAAGLAPEVILNCGHWLLPLGGDRAKVGATYAPGRDDLVPEPAARAELERSAAALLERNFSVRAHEVGLRLGLPDKRPVAGRCPGAPGLAVLGGLGSKGVLLAPWLARQWLDHLSAGTPFDPAVDVARFWPDPAGVRKIM
ncbi:MAG TPA: FAD-dependent oxidoreductase [Opitutaceae bacterium]|nr:FAD-dependent oxidoreductase [Opitutaceae bacterium]